MAQVVHSAYLVAHSFDTHSDRCVVHTMCGILGIAMLLSFVQSLRVEKNEHIRVGSNFNRTSIIRAKRYELRVVC